MILQNLKGGSALAGLDGLLGLPKPVLAIVALATLVIGAIAFDYARMLSLRRKMVRSLSTPLCFATHSVAASWSVAMADHWKYIQLARHEALDIL